MTDQPRDLAAEVEEIRQSEHGSTQVAILLLHIDALSRELEDLRRPLAELKKEAESEEGMEPQRMMQYLCRRVDALQKATRRLQPDNERLRAENERLSKQIEHLDACNSRQANTISALRRPVEQNAEIEEIRRDQWPVLIEHLTTASPELLGKLLKDQGNRKAWQIHTLLTALDTTAHQLRERVEMLEAAQREICELKEERAEYLETNSQTNKMLLEIGPQLLSERKARVAAEKEIARLSSPPQERAEIVARLKSRLEVFTCHPGSAIDDVRTLLGDCAAWRNALGVSQDALSERNRECVELRGKLERAEHEARAQAQCIKRLEGALRQIQSEGTKTQTRRVGDIYSADGWEQYEVVTHAAQIAADALAAADGPALAASQQHTAGSGDGVAGVPMPSVPDKDGYRYCEFCGCHTNAKQRFCCDRGMQADKQRHANNQRPIPGIDQGQFLAECCGGNAAFGERNSGGTPE